MSHPRTLVEIEMVIQAYYLAGYKPERGSPVQEEALDRLLRADILKFNYDHETVSTTPRGRFWVKHLLSVPYPVESFKIPEVPA